MKVSLFVSPACSDERMLVQPEARKTTPINPSINVRVVEFCFTLISPCLRLK